MKIKHLFFTLEISCPSSTVSLGLHLYELSELSVFFGFLSYISQPWLSPTLNLYAGCLSSSELHTPREQGWELAPQHHQMLAHTWSSQSPFNGWVLSSGAQQSALWYSSDRSQKSQALLLLLLIFFCFHSIEKLLIFGHQIEINWQNCSVP